MMKTMTEASRLRVAVSKRSAAPESNLPKHTQTSIDCEEDSQAYPLCILQVFLLHDFLSAEHVCW